MTYTQGFFFVHTSGLKSATVVPDSVSYETLQLNSDCNYCNEPVADQEGRGANPWGSGANLYYLTNFSPNTA